MSDTAQTVSENFEIFTNGSITAQSGAWAQNGGWSLSATVTNSPGGLDGHGNVLLVGDTDTKWSFPAFVQGVDPVVRVEHDMFLTSNQKRTLTYDQGWSSKTAQESCPTNRSKAW